ncbi:hypothetical protein BHE74_00015118 [Ensete ventricosum]|uniref:Uncharacterized protein n=1 Tax=Ensete ventricosum TaxID=4639 RepID=A0A427A8C1_ENSVE|nr:hypothetical protein B296_00029049 [Ensete ventricosum]RWW16784.1 hypothetical protein GW17_00019315 [Ensete ventricosum]RWW76767.1 hypothetical protein BHE74_00015118 [Ensete ventricosum]RZR92438.1 hypothetical protein BHM03_00020743 [Ensete ventricosum]
MGARSPWVKQGRSRVRRRGGRRGKRIIAPEIDRYANPRRRGGGVGKASKEIAVGQGRRSMAMAIEEPEDRVLNRELMRTHVTVKSHSMNATPRKRSHSLATQTTSNMRDLTKKKEGTNVTRPSAD